MECNGLLKALEDQIEAEREELIASARKKADAIIKAAKQEADHRVKIAMETQAASEAARKAKEADKPQQIVTSKLLLQFQYDLYKQAIDAAKMGLSKVSGRADYSQILKKLLQEATAGFPSAAKVMVSPEDVPQIKKILDDLNLKLEVVSGQNVSSGVAVSSEDGKLVRYNTLNSRLEKALPNLSTRIAQVLYG